MGRFYRLDQPGPHREYFGDWRTSVVVAVRTHELGWPSSTDVHPAVIDGGVYFTAATNECLRGRRANAWMTEFGVDK